MELYCDQADPSNSLNLLKYFRLDKEGDIRKFAPPLDATARHFAYVFGPSQIESLKTAFHRLRPALRDFIKDKEKRALEEHSHILEKSAEELAREFADNSKKRFGREVNPKNHEERLTKFKDELARLPAELFSDRAFSQIKPARGAV